MIYCRYILFFTRDLHKYIMKRFQFSLAVHVILQCKEKMKITIISIAHIANITSYILGQYQISISNEIGHLHITYNELYIVLHNVLECYTSDTNVQGYPFLFPFAAYFHKTASKIDTIQLQWRTLIVKINKKNSRVIVVGYYSDLN